MIKKIFSVLIAVLIFSSFAVSSYAADSIYDELAALDIVPSGFTSENGHELVTRAEFAYIAANLMQSGMMEAKSTKFIDVDSSNQYSGYVDFLTEIGILSGVSENTYAPDGNVTAEMAYKVMVSVLGYNQIAQQLGGYPTGYAKVADRIGFTTNLSFSGQYLTREGALLIAHYVLTNCFDELIYFASNGELVVATDSKSAFSVLGGRHNISVYTGNVEAVSDTGFANIRIQSNKYDTNPEILAKNSVVAFEANGKNVREYEGANVTVWVNSDNQIVYIALKRNADVKYGYIYSVNGITNATGIPAVSSLEKLTLINDEEDYEISSDVKVRYNGKLVTNSVKLEGNFARLVFQNDEIIFIETWDLTEAGIISAVATEYIEYTKGGTSGLKLRDIDKFKNKRFYIDNSPAGEGHIKADIVFDYYASDDDLLIVASEKKIIDKFHSYSKTGLEIGDSIYKYKKLYYSTGDLYKEDADFNGLLNTEVSAYAGPDGYIRYIKVNDASLVSERSLFGVVYGVKTDSFNEEYEIGVYVYGDEITKTTLKANDKTYFAPGCDITSLNNNKKDIDGNGVYFFTLNGKGTIQKIEKPIPFYGYDTDASGRVTWSESSINSDSTTFVDIGGKRLFFKNVPMMTIYENNGEFTVEKIKSSDIIGKDNLEITLTFLGDEQNSPSPSMVLVTGNLISLGNYGKKYGVVMEKRLSISENGEQMVDLYVTQGDSTPIIYSVTESYANTLPDVGLIEYKNETMYSENDIYVTKFKSFVGGTSNWVLDTTKNEGLFEGKVEKIQGDRLYLENDAFYMTQGASAKLIVKYDENGGSRAIKVIEASEISKGDYIYYYLVKGVVRAIIVAD